jgi:SOS response regulatory protein OraA/RecX
MYHDFPRVYDGGHGRRRIEAKWVQARIEARVIHKVYGKDASSTKEEARAKVRPKLDSSALSQNFKRT